MSDHEIALTLAIARAESGFNPDAASNESATGLGQLIYNTARHYGITDENRWNMDLQAKALVLLTKNNMAAATRRGFSGRHLERYTYKYHHDGLTGEHGGLTLADQKVLPYISVYLDFLQKRRSLSRAI